MAWAKTKVRNKAHFVLAANCYNIELNLVWSKKQTKYTPAKATLWEEYI